MTNRSQACFSREFCQMNFRRLRSNSEGDPGAYSPRRTNVHVGKVSATGFGKKADIRSGLGFHAIPTG